MCSWSTDVHEGPVWLRPHQGWPHPMQRGGSEVSNRWHHSDHQQAGPELVARQSGEQRCWLRRTDPLPRAPGMVNSSVILSDGSLLLYEVTLTITCQRLTLCYISIDHRTEQKCSQLNWNLSPPPPAGGWQVKARPERAVSPAAHLERKRSAKTSTWLNTAPVSVALESGFLGCTVVWVCLTQNLFFCSFWPAGCDFLWGGSSATCF